MAEDKKGQNDDRIKELIKKRGTVKGRLTIFGRYITSLENETLSFKQRSELKLRMHGAHSLYTEFTNIQNEIEILVSDTELERQLEARESFEAEYYSVLARAQCMADYEKTDDEFKSHSESQYVKLPTISLPEFDGSYEHWLEFRDTFTSLVHKSKSLSKIQKYHYLKSSLKGTAQLVIDSVEFSSENYAIAWELLLNRYDNSELLVHNHLKSLFSIPSVSKESSCQLRNLIDTVLKNLRALKLLGEPTEYWDTLIIYLVVTKLDNTTEREWEQHKNIVTQACDASKGVKVEQLLQFLREKADMLDKLQSSQKPSVQDKKHTAVSNKIHCNVTNTSQTKQNTIVTKHKFHKLCQSCGGQHPLYSCQKFLDLGFQDRLKLIRGKNLCENCFRSGHSSAECRYGPCRKCEKKHNTLICDVVHQVNAHTATLHSADEVLHDSRGDTITYNAHAQTYTSQVHAHTDDYSAHSSCAEPVLLSTALVELPDSLGNLHKARAILDSGSERCFITQALCDKLKTKTIQSTKQIKGVGNSVTQCTQTCQVEVRSLNDTYSTRIQCLVLPRITSQLPSITLQSKQFSIPNNITLADPLFFESQPIDILLGADVFWDLINEGKMRLSNGPFLQNTKLGWIISGSVANYNKKFNHVNCNFTQSIDMQAIDKQVRRFWELEELPIAAGTKSADLRSDEERACEGHFVETTKRTAEGRFCVQIPFKISPDALGETYAQASRRFYALESRLERNPAYKAMYSDFINEYIRLGHMTRVDYYSSPHYFMPHHGVFREHATTTKLRVVFDASATSSSGQSLNDLQMVGPPIQGDLIAILLRFRENSFVACADIEKMYRQVLVDTPQRQLQLIVWRENPKDRLSIYQLNTVTYGTASAPFLSCRCLKQLALECNDPDVTRTINEDFYVDDLICGANSKDKLISLCENTSQVLNSGCFPLRKWIYNFESENMSHTQHDSKNFTLGEHVHSKTLGLGWYPKQDQLYFHSQFERNTKSVTKRTILSVASQIYDPLGLLSPVITQAKILVQKCWELKLEWDEPVPSDISVSWNRFVSCLSPLNTVRVPRNVMCHHPVRTELHIFTDASQAAYGACAYIRTTASDSDNATVRLLCSKGKVASLKPTVTIPRLELCGAVLGARLYTKIKKSLRSNIDEVVFWTDSTIVLCWLRTQPKLLKPYVQNRVSEIQELTNDHSWRHIKGKFNPADLVSRGQSLDILSSSSVWWEGPEFLQDPQFQYNEDIELPSDNLPEFKNNTHSLITNQSSDELFTFSRFSQFVRMQRAAAYVLRFIHNARNSVTRRRGALTADELSESTALLARLSQRESFSDARNSLLKNGVLKHTQGHLSKLNLFLDNREIIRVGGRLENSTEFSFDKKHPILISCKHPFTVLLFRHEHRQCMHAAPQLLLFTVRDSWWPVGGRNLARKTYHECVTCTRLRGQIITPIMGNLPQERLDPGFPFVHCGVDYAGPMLILNRTGRGAKTVKAYICLFICFTTRAVHLELVGDLSSDAYLLALKRFISRRGKPAEIFSDNGKNFVGLNNEFTKFISSCSDVIKDYATSQNIKFKMCPPYASHFGGLWEAGVKSCKYHLRRVVGNAHLTFEEFSTVLTQVEAILNSRPLTQMSSNPQDLLPLSPAHFLVGRPLTAPVMPDLNTTPPHRLSRYQRVEQIRQHFWARWAKEYVSELQVRVKWMKKQAELKIGTLVVIKEDSQPPLRWSLGRILAVFPGKDGVARVADIRTSSGVVRRAFTKICPLPCE